MRNRSHLNRSVTRIAAVAGLIASLAIGPAAIAEDDALSLVNTSGVYTLVNLHPDPENSRLYSVNYQLPYLIPVCTEVLITSLKKKKMKFEVVKTGKEYNYLWHRKATPEGLNSHLVKFFGKECPEDEIKTLSEIDQKGIDKGKAYQGMTKRGIIIAMGYPPPHVTPDLDMDQWMYWMNRFNRTAIEFTDDGIVEEIRN